MPQRKFDLKQFLDEKVAQYNRPAFLLEDPVCIPHLFTRKQDQEIAGFFAAVFAWGNRATIINKSKELMALMGQAPYEFCRHAGARELKRLETFKHRTFTATDLLYFVEFFRFHYEQQDSLEAAFMIDAGENGAFYMEGALNRFHHYFFSLEHVPGRTRKHIAAPCKGSTCKRLNMFLRWMVRNDNNGVDLGLWKRISPAQLICPVDLHVARVVRHFNLLSRKQTDWAAAVELTAHLRELDPADPVKYDFALFALGVVERFQ